MPDTTLLPSITEQAIWQNSTAQSYERGEDYYASGAVQDTIRRDMTLEASVEGSQYMPYRVTVTFDKIGIKSALCTCPYAFGGYCKHIVAILLTYLRQPEVFIQCPEAADRLAELSPEQLRLLIANLIEQKPELGDWFLVMIDSLATSPPAATSTSGSQRHTPVDEAAFRRQVSRAVGLLDYRNHWESIWAMIDGLDAAQAQAAAFLNGADFHNALALMLILGEEVIPDYEQLEEESQLADFLDGWSGDLTEAILGARLSQVEREELSQQLEGWTESLADYGLDEVLDRPLTACVRGWESPLDSEGLDLIDAQLNVLEYEGRTEDYLKFCLEHQAHYRYARRLVETGRIEEATGHALNHPMSADEYLKLAQTLHEKGHAGEALGVGLKGLSGEGRKFQLGEWLAGLAEKLDRPDAARQAWQAAFNDLPNLEGYQNLKRLAGDEWAALRPELIARLQQPAYQPVLIEALIDDQEVDEAIRIWDQQTYGSYTLLEKLVDAAAANHPDWAVEHALKEANGLINKASKYYPHAIRWLGKVKAIYLQHGRLEDWQACLSKVRAEHGRKYSLMGQIDDALR